LFEPTQGGKAVRRDSAEAVATSAIRSSRDLPFVRTDPRSPARAPVSLEKIMIEAIAVILVIMWLLGMLTHVMLGGLIHILLILAVVAVVIRLITGRRPVV
jgi:uncharacterized protein DUF5670